MGKVAMTKPLPSELPPIQRLSTVEADVPKGSKKYLSHFVDAVVRPDGSHGYHHRLEFAAGVMIAHLERVDGSLWLPMIDHYRYPINRWSRELPSGGVEAGDASLEDAAARELLEETGVKVASSDLRPLFPGPLYGSIGVANQSFHIFEGSGGSVELGDLDDEERAVISSGMYRLEDVYEMIGREVVENATTAAIGRLLYREVTTGNPHIR